MRAYKIVPLRRHEPVTYLQGADSTTPLDAALKEFRTTYGFDGYRTLRDLRRYNRAQVSLARDASFLGLEHNPLYDELSQVFVDWAKKRFGYREFDPTGEHAAQAEEFRFPY